MIFLNKTKTAVTAILLSVSSQAFADIVKGTVLDETGEAAIGVTVTVKDTKIAAVTDLWKRRVCLTPWGTRDLTPRAK